jgi:hypothetical protein
MLRDALTALGTFGRGNPAAPGRSTTLITLICGPCTRQGHGNEVVATVVVDDEQRRVWEPTGTIAQQFLDDNSDRGPARDHRVVEPALDNLLATCPRHAELSVASRLVREWLAGRLLVTTIDYLAEVG